MQGAIAAPPLRIQLPGHAPLPVPYRVQPQNPVQTQQRHLDLRAPSHVPEAVENGGDRSFPSRRTTLGAQESVQLPALGADGVRSRPTVQEFVRRVRREGLPVARLYEGKSALIHVGLSPKGKPGLWLVQKTR
jgi:hypothetical protein